MCLASLSLKLICVYDCVLQQSDDVTLSSVHHSVVLSNDTVLLRDVIASEFEASNSCQAKNSSSALK